MKKMKKIVISFCAALALVGAGVATMNTHEVSANETAVQVVETVKVAALDKSASGLSVWGGSSYGTLSYDTSVKYANEAGSVKYTSKKNAANNSYNGIQINAPLVTDVSAYDYLVFHVYNPNATTVKAGIMWTGEVECASKEWTEVKIDLATASFGRLSGDYNPSKSNLTGMELRIYENTLNAGESVYISAIYAVKGEYELGSFKMLDGASIRTEAPYGIRFTTEISKTDAAKLPENAKFGTLLYPTSQLNGKTIQEALAENPELEVVDVATNVWATDEDGAVVSQYHSVLIGETKEEGLPEYLWNKQLTAASYVTYTVDGVEYKAWAANSQSRSLLWVASDVVADGEAEGEFYNAIFESAFANGISFNEYEAAMNIAETQTLSVNATDDMGSALSLVWESSNDEVATVENGVVKAVGTGEATITVKLGGLSAEATINVTKEPVAIFTPATMSSNVTNKGGISAVSYDTTNKYDDEAGSLKVTYSMASECYLVLNELIISDLTSYDYIVFRVYNPTSATVTVGITWKADTKCNAGQWTEVKIDLNKIYVTEGSSATDMRDNSAIPRNDMTGLTIRVVSGMTVGQSLYFSTLYAM